MHRNRNEFHSGVTPAVTLETPRLLLRPWREADLAPLFEINGDADSMRHFQSTMTRDESDAWAGPFPRSQRALSPWQESFNA